MDKRRHLSGIQQLGDVQKLRLANEQLRLVEVQDVSRKAEAKVTGCHDQLDASDIALTQLLSASQFCPDLFRLACGNLLLDEAELRESEEALFVAQSEESEQRIVWHQNRQQSEWLDAQNALLSRKLARAKEDKRLVEVVASRWVIKGDND